MNRIAIISFIWVFIFGGQTTTLPLDEKADINISSEYAIVYNVKDQRALFEKRANDQIYPASMTKVMSAMVALEEIDDLEQTVQIQPEAFLGVVESNASVAGFEVGQTLSYRDLLAGVILPSGAEATKQLAYSLFGSEANMVQAMNKKAQTLGLEHTHFTNVSGLHDDEHTSTVYEIAKIMEAAVQNPDLKALLEANSYEISALSMILYSTLADEKETISDETIYTQGSKTGFTLEAGLCLVSFSEFNNEMYISVVASSKESEQLAVLLDTETLYDYVDNHFKRTTIFSKNDFMTNIPIQGIRNSNYKYKAKNNYTLQLENDIDVKDLNYQYEIKKDLKAPLTKGMVVGELQIFDQDKQLGAIDLILSENIERYNIMDILWNWLVGSLLAIIAIGLGIGLFRWKRNK